MKLSEIKALNSRIPQLYAGRTYVKRCGYRKAFEIDAEILDVKTPKLVEDEEGNKTPLVSPRTGQAIFDHMIYIPFKGRDGIQYLTQTKSPLIRSIVSKVPVTRTETNDAGEILEYHEAIEGLLVFGEGEYRYGTNEVPVTTLEDAEE